MRVYNGAIALLAASLSGRTFRVLLLDEKDTFNASHATVDDILDSAATERVSDYGRPVVNAKQERVGDFAFETVFKLANKIPIRAFLDGNTGSAVIYEVGTNDEDSPPLLFLDSGDFPTFVGGEGARARYLVSDAYSVSPTAVTAPVQSTGVTAIVVLTAAEYGGLTAADANTLYVVSDTPAVYLGDTLVAEPNAA